MRTSIRSLLLLLALSISTLVLAAPTTTNYHMARNTEVAPFLARFLGKRCYGWCSEARDIDADTPVEVPAEAQGEKRCAGACSQARDLIPAEENQAQTTTEEDEIDPQTGKRCLGPCSQGRGFFEDEPGVGPVAEKRCAGACSQARDAADDNEGAMPIEGEEIVTDSQPEERCYGACPIGGPPTRCCPAIIP